MSISNSISNTKFLFIYWVSGENKKNHWLCYSAQRYYFQPIYVHLQTACSEQQQQSFLCSLHPHLCKEFGHFLNFNLGKPLLRVLLDILFFLCKAMKLSLPSTFQLDHSIFHHEHQQQCQYSPCNREYCHGSKEFERAPTLKGAIVASVVWSTADTLSSFSPFCFMSHINNTFSLSMPS